MSPLDLSLVVVGVSCLSTFAVASRKALIYRFSPDGFFTAALDFKELQPALSQQPAIDPATLAAKLTVAPMTPQGQVDVVNLVTQLAGVIAEERQESAELRERLGRLPDDVERRLKEFERRLSMAEAGAALGQARAAGKAPAQTAAPAPSPVAAEAPPPVRTTASAPSVGPAVRRYEIRAASPGLAVLGTLDGVPEVKELAVGDQVPGYGRVNAIVQQKGGAWVVQCDRGTIQ